MMLVDIVDDIVDDIVAEIKAKRLMLVNEFNKTV